MHRYPNSIKGTFFIILLITAGIAHGQGVINDTLNIRFIPDSFIPINIKVDSVTDYRNVNPRMVSHTSKKKYLIVPIDQEICVEEPLNIVLKNSLDESLTAKISDTISMGINQFIIDKYTGRLSNYYVLKADFELHKSSNYLGTLSYSYRYAPKVRKTSKPVICEELIQEWHQQFKLDLLSVNSYINDTNELRPDNFVEKKLRSHSFFNATIAAVVGLNFWQVEGELYFLRPEIGEPQQLQSGFLRYQKLKDLEMIGFGKKMVHRRTRLTPNMLLDINTSLMLGINKWKNPEEVKLEQILQISFSSSQAFVFENENESGLLLKFGLFENVYYIVHEPLKFQFGLYIGGGYKF